MNQNLKGIRLKNITGCFRMGGQSDGFKVFYENKDILKKYNISKTMIYSNMISSIIKVTLSKYLPKKLIKFLKKFNVHSKNRFY